MKHLVIIISLFIMVAAFPAVAAADDWDAYQAYNSRFYFLDQQDFNTITCDIESSTLTQLVDMIRKQVEPFADRIELVTKLDNFSMKYNKTSGLTVERPELDIKIKSEEGMTDPDRVRKGVSMIRSGFKQALDGLTMELEGILESYKAEKREDLSNVKVVEKDGTVTATYQKKGGDFTETFSGKTVELTQVGPGGKVHIVGNLEKTIHDKLILKNATVSMDQESGTALSSTASMTYQKVGGVVFPRQIIMNTKLESKTAKQEGKTDITLTNCKAD
jgi:hypothetical protein